MAGDWAILSLGGLEESLSLSGHILKGTGTGWSILEDHPDLRSYTL
jgi:hypothetical protein